MGTSRLNVEELVTRARNELARLSEAKLNEPWTNRDAQKQILSNVLFKADVSRPQRAGIVAAMAGRALGDLANVVREELEDGS